MRLYSKTYSKSAAAFHGGPVTAIPMQDPASALDSNEDVSWLITLSDLTLLLICFLGLWYVKNQERRGATEVVEVSVHAPAERHYSEAVIEESAHAADWHALKSEIDAFVARAGMKREVSVASTPNEILLSFNDAVPFASGEAEIRRTALPVLEKVASLAVERPAMRLEVNGHTDDRPISSAQFPSNWELSSARASRVARYLVENGVHPERIKVQGFADYRPRDSNKTLTGRSANRRVEIRLIRNGDSVPAQTPDSTDP